MMMASADILASLGLLVRRDFLDPDLRRTLLEEVRSSASSASGVVREGASSDQLNEEARRTRRVSVSRGAVELMNERLATLKPQVEEHFAVTLEGFQEPQFLTYRRGDFFHAHTDGEPLPGLPSEISQRKVSVVVFLNGHGSESTQDSFEGGALVFYGLFDERRAQRIGLPLDAEPGLIVAFRSDLVHEVQPVENGERHTVVSWYV
jgi:SM-20-related protein